MHASQRKDEIVAMLQKRGFLAFRDLEKALSASPATLRRDLDQLAKGGLLARVHGGAKLIGDGAKGAPSGPHLAGVPFSENVTQHLAEKEAIGRAAAGLCTVGEAVMIDGGSTTLQMCPHVEGLNLQVLTNSLHIVNALLGQPGTRLSVPGGAIFPEQNIILSTGGDELMPRFHAPKLFMGCAAVGPHGIMQADVVLVAAERRLIDRAEQIILLVDSSKFGASSGNVVCELADVDIVVTDSGIKAEHRAMLKERKVRLIVA